MHPLRATSFALLCFVVAGCATSNVYRQTIDGDEEGEIREGSTRFEKITATAFWVPALSVTADEDELEVNGGVEFDADLDTGSGVGIRIGTEGDEGGIGILYMTTRHDERELDSDARTHSGYIEYFKTLVEPNDDGWGFRVGFGAGIGGAVFDFDDGFDDTGGAAGEARAVVGFGSDTVGVELGAGGFLWGYPGETIGYGSFGTLGMVIRF